jgi:hypothetical protein
VLHLSHLTCTRTECNLHFANYLQPGFKEPGLYRLLTFQVQISLSFFVALIFKTCSFFVNNTFDLIPLSYETIKYIYWDPEDIIRKFPICFCFNWFHTLLCAGTSVISEIIDCSNRYIQSCPVLMYHITKTCGRVEIKLLAFLTSALHRSH